MAAWLFYVAPLISKKADGSLVVEALFYKPEGRGSRPDEVNEFFFQLIYPSGRTVPWGLLSL
jgi:hypothetical protein